MTCCECHWPHHVDSGCQLLMSGAHAMIADRVQQAGVSGVCEGYWPVCRPLLCAKPVAIHTDTRSLAPSLPPPLPFAIAPSPTEDYGCAHSYRLSHSHSLLFPSHISLGVMESASASAPSPNDDYGCAHALYLDLGDLNSVEAFASE